MDAEADAEAEHVRRARRAGRVLAPAEHAGRHREDLADGRVLRRTLGLKATSRHLKDVFHTHKLLERGV